jgi:hypothetical protein
LQSRPAEGGIKPHCVVRQKAMHCHQAKCWESPGSLGKTYGGERGSKSLGQCLWLSAQSTRMLWMSLRKKGCRVMDGYLISAKCKWFKAHWCPLFDMSVRYSLKEHCWHGEARSVDLVAVAEEWERLLKILAKYAKKDQLNFDESGLFGLYAQIFSSELG